MIIIGAEGKMEEADLLMGKLNEIAKEKKIEIQIMDADLVCGRDHIISACEHAIRAFREKRNAMRRISMEILLYAAGERQIVDAINKIGIKKGKGRFVFVFLTSRDFEEIDGEIDENEAVEIIRWLGMRPNDDVMKISRDKLKNLGFSDEEIDTVEKDKYGDLALEKVAMLDIIK